METLGIEPRPPGLEPGGLPLTYASVVLPLGFAPRIMGIPKLQILVDLKTDQSPSCLTATPRECGVALWGGFEPPFPEGVDVCFEIQLEGRLMKTIPFSD